MNARSLNAPADRKRAQPLASVASLRSEPLAAALKDPPPPVEGLHIVPERRSPEDADLRDVGRTQPRHPSFPLDRLDHRRLFAADVRAGAAPQMDRHERYRRIRLQRRDFVAQDLADVSVLVAQIDEDLVDADRPRRNPDPFETAVRIAFEIPAVLERPRFALVDVDRHDPRGRLPSNDAPL